MGICTWILIAFSFIVLTSRWTWRKYEPFTTTQQITQKAAQTEIESAYAQLRVLEGQARHCISNGINNRREFARHTRIRNKIIAIENHINRLRLIGN